MTYSRSFWWAIGSLPLMVVGALSPWAQVVRTRIDGPQDEIVLALAFAAAVMLVAFAGSRHRWLALVPLLAGAAAAVLTGRDVRDTGDITSHVNERLATLDWGLYLTVLGSISLVLASMVMVVEGASPRRGRAQREAFFAQAAAFTPYVAVRSNDELFFVSTLDERLGGGVFAREGGRLDVAVLRRATRLLEERGIRTEGTTFVEVGANIGTTTVAAIRRRNFLRAVAIEPAPDNFQTLQLNLVANKIAPVVTAIEAAASDREGEELLGLARGTSGGHMLEAHLSGPREEAIPVRTVTIDALVERGVIDPVEVGLLWLDAHGNEAKALAGASSLLEAGIPVVTAIRPHLASWPVTRVRLIELLGGYHEFVELRGQRRRAADLGLLLDLIGETTGDIIAVPRSAPTLT